MKFADGVHRRERGGKKYEERLRAYLKGDESVFVSEQFKSAVAKIGKEHLNFDSLAGSERNALASLDARWRIGLDGVLLWEPNSGHKKDGENSPDCAWMKDGALICWNSVNGSLKQLGPCSPNWLESWAECWEGWGYRYTSFLYESHRAQAERDGHVNPARKALMALSITIKALRFLFLEYFPKSRLVSTDGRWPLPQDLLSNKNHPLDSNDLRDDFWNTCCVADGANFILPDGRERTVYTSGARRSLEVQRFLDFVTVRLGNGNAEVSGGSNCAYRNPFLPRSTLATLLELDKTNQYLAPKSRGSDRFFDWIPRDYPHLRAWQSFAAEFVNSESGGVSRKMSAISVFFGQVLIGAVDVRELGNDLFSRVSLQPLDFLRRTNSDLVKGQFERLVDPMSRRAISEFLNHILRHHCTIVDEMGPIQLPEFGNPMSAENRLRPKFSSNTVETLRQAMPYSWIKGLRKILVRGPHFRDWKWAIQAQQAKDGRSADWFEVPKELIDESDPDCIWRVRFLRENGKPIARYYEMWSPVRWVVLLTKLTTALRTAQVRVLDSGESDDMRFDLRAWAESSKQNKCNGSPISPWVSNSLKERNAILFAAVSSQKPLRKRAKGRSEYSWSNGVLRPCVSFTSDGSYTDTLIYVNTNKTADSRKEGAAKGFEVPLPLMECPMTIGDDGEFCEPQFQAAKDREEWLEELSQNIHWWLAKLRDWQEKYNPVGRRIEWSEFSGTTIIKEKSEEQYAMHRAACFLFREPAMKKTKKHPGPSFPPPDSVIGRAWWSLNRELQDTFAKEGKRNLDGTDIVLVLSHQGLNKTCVFDLHSIRVSLITSLVVDGKVPMEIVQRLVGHSRILMTLYYTKLTSGRMQQALREGFARLNADSSENELLYLQNASTDEIRANAAFHDEASAFAALGLGKEPQQRPVAAWVRVVGGICPVGAVARNTEGSLQAGCFNGGELLGSGGKTLASGVYGPVAGGERSCPNCRWFVTTPAHVPELIAMFEVTQYKVFEIDERAIHQAMLVRAAIAEEDEAHQQGIPVRQLAELTKAVERAQQLSDSISEQGIVSKVTLGNTYRLIQRCLEITNRRENFESDDALILAGGEMELGVILNETTSEMLHLCRISQHAEIFPELDPGKAILKCSEIMAKKLSKEGVDPFLILGLSESERCRITNAVMRSISRRINPNDDNAGFHAAVRIVEGPHTIADALGIKKAALPDFLAGCSASRSEPLRLGIASRNFPSLIEYTAGDQ